MRPYWLVAGVGSLALSWYWQRRRRSDLTDLDQRLAGQIQRLGERESDLEQQVALLRRQELELAEHVERLGQQERELESQVQGIGDREEGLHRRIDQLREQELSLQQTIEEQADRIKALQQTERLSGDSIWHHMVPHKNFNILVHLAQQQLSGIQLPNSALKDPKRLNSAMESNWLRDTWLALGSLHEYASTEHDYRGDYLSWTRKSGHRNVWHVSRIAMSESQPTIHRHGQTRIFPVDPRVDPSGRLEMLAHLKVEAKGKVRPRVFFHDDTEGETGLVHIGFIGPHDLVPVSSHK